MKKLKKFFSVLLAVGIFFGSQITSPPTVSAWFVYFGGNEPYVFSIDGLKWYLYRIRSDVKSQFPNTAYLVEIVSYPPNGEGYNDIDFRFYFFHSDYKTFHSSRSWQPGGVLEKGYISQNPRAKKLAGIIYAYENIDGYRYTSDE